MAYARRLAESTCTTYQARRSVAVRGDILFMLLENPRRINNSIAAAVGVDRDLVARLRAWLVANGHPECVGPSRSEQRRAGTLAQVASGRHGARRLSLEKARKAGWCGIGMRGSWVPILDELRLGGPAGVRELQRRLAARGIRQYYTTLYNVVGRIVAAGYARKTGGNGGRTTAVELTEAGRNVWQKPDSDAI